MNAERCRLWQSSQLRHISWDKFLCVSYTWLMIQSPNFIWSAWDLCFRTLSFFSFLGEKRSFFSSATVSLLAAFWSIPPTSDVLLTIPLHFLRAFIHRVSSNPDRAQPFYHSFKKKKKRSFQHKLSELKLRKLWEGKGTPLWELPRSRMPTPEKLTGWLRQCSLTRFENYTHFHLLVTLTW